MEGTGEEEADAVRLTTGTGRDGTAREEERDTVVWALFAWASNMGRVSHKLVGRPNKPGMGGSFGYLMRPRHISTVRRLLWSSTHRGSIRRHQLGGASGPASPRCPPANGTKNAGAVRYTYRASAARFAVAAFTLLSCERWNKVSSVFRPPVRL